MNDAGMIEVVRRAASDVLADDAVTTAVQSWGGDDFAWFTRQVPGAYVRLGVHDPTSDRPRLDLHAGLFDADERAIAIGIRLAVRTLAEFARTP